MASNTSKLIIGFITYGKLTSKYLPYFLPSLKEQTFKDFKVIVIDNSEEEDNENVKYIKENYPEVKIERPGKNIGFARANNLIIKRAVNLGAGYVMIINPDMILEPEAIERMVEVMDGSGGLGSVSPKVLSWDFGNNKKTNIIDSCGIKMESGLRFFDIGQAQVDQGQFNNIEILGPSGAVAIYRVSALEKVKRNNQYFDELMFMYKEDCDLAYRLYLAGFKSKCVGGAIIYHDRSVGGKGESDLQIALNRRSKSRQNKKWAFLNQHIIFLKYWKLQNRQNKLAILWYELKMIGFVLLFEQYLLGQYIKLWKIKKYIKVYKVSV